MKVRTLGVWLVAAATLVAGAVVFRGDAGAQRLRANIFLTQHEIPRNLTEQGLIGFARRNAARRLREGTDRPIPQREWTSNMVTSFNTPPGDLEFQVLFYDIQEGDRFIGPSLSTFINNRQEKTFLQRIRLERPRFRPNRRMELRVVVRRQEVGRQRFELVGEEVRHSGEVTFD
ncbi:MAG: hypothetical protein KF901_32410 [Myxococcales bacterium]|nr:hypothetical protein [Myxococcales bacterium]